MDHWIMANGQGKAKEFSGSLLQLMYVESNLWLATEDSTRHHIVRTWLCRCFW